MTKETIISLTKGELSDIIKAIADNIVKKYSKINHTHAPQVDITGNAATATKATRDAIGQRIDYTYIKDLTANGNIITLIKGDNTTSTISTRVNTGADYAEMFEWLDGNPNNEDRRGMFVTLEGDKIKLASNGDYILGVVSSNPSIVANTYTDEWAGKYLEDEFGVYLTDENNNRVLNPEFKSEEKYISRLDRPEWTAIGMLGILNVRHDGTATVNRYVTVNKDGIGMACDKNTPNSYRVIKVKSNDVCMIIFR